MIATLIAGGVFAACSGPGGASNPTAAVGASSGIADPSPHIKAKSGSLYVMSINPELPGTIAVYSGTPLKRVRFFQNGVGGDGAMVFNSQRQLLVSNYQYNDATVYAANGDNPIRTLSKKIKQPTEVAVTSNNIFYVNERDHITMFFNAQQQKTKMIHQGANNLTIDASDNVYVASPNNTITVYAPGATEPSRKITGGLSNPGNLITDSSGNLYVANQPTSGCGNVTVYEAATGTLEYTITNGICGPGGMAIDAAGNLYVGNHAQSTVTEYASGTNSLIGTISKGVTAPGRILIDPAGNLYVCNTVGFSHGDVTVYSPGKTSPSQTLTKNINYPADLAWLP